MLNKKGFSFIEVLVIVVLIAVLSLVAVPSYKKGVETSRNNQAKGKLVEIANAAKMYNEDARGSERVAGYFGAHATGFTDPKYLFSNTSGGASGSNYAYLKDVGSFSGTDYTYRGYKFYICKPDGDDSGTADAKCGDYNVIAIMEATSAITDERYAGKTWKVSTENPGKVAIVSQ